MNSKQFSSWLACQEQLSLNNLPEPLGSGNNSAKSSLSSTTCSRYPELSYSMHQNQTGSDEQIAGRHLNQPLIMGILNITPDSFSDGGKFLSIDRASEQAFHLISQGADLIDIGGQSTRPGAEPVPLELELQRVIPVIEQIRINSDICISIDTHKPEVMEAAVNAGADVINDVYALRTKGALAMAAKLAVPLCLMHMQGEPRSMQHNIFYPEGVLTEVRRFFLERLLECERVGIKRGNIILDPGFGFGKQIQDNLLLIKNLDSFATFAQPLLLGVSRKSTIGAVLNKELGERLIGGVALAVYAVLKGVGIIRTHDVNEAVQALQMISTIEQVNAEVHSYL